MCVTIDKAELSRTKIAWWVSPDGKTNLAYQNNPKSKSGPNAMLLHFPHHGLLQQGTNVIDTSQSPRILINMEAACQGPQAKSLDLSVSRSSAPVFSIFESGIYTMVAARSTMDLLSALEDPRIPQNKRVTIDQALCEYYANAFDSNNWAILMCLFDNKDAKKSSEPIWVRYNSTLPKGVAHLPGLDAHTGKAPKAGKVDVDAFVMFGNNAGMGNPVYYSHSLERVPANLPTHVFGMKYSGKEDNGDYILQPEDLLVGNTFGIQRLMPGQY